MTLSSSWIFIHTDHTVNSLSMEQALTNSPVYQLLRCPFSIFFPLQVSCQGWCRGGQQISIRKGDNRAGCHARAMPRLRKKMRRRMPCRSQMHQMRLQSLWSWGAKWERFCRCQMFHSVCVCCCCCCCCCCCYVMVNFPTRGPLVRLNEGGASKFGRTSLVI